MEWKGHRKGKSGQEQDKTQPQASKGKNKGKKTLETASKRKVSPPRERNRAKAKTRKGFTGGESNKDLRQSQSYKRARYLRCFEHLVAVAGMSCLYICHQWHRVEEAVYFWLLTSRSVCNLNSRQAPCIPWSVVWLVGTHNAKHRVRGRELPDLSHLTQAIRDTENKLRWSVKRGQNESEKLEFANMTTKLIVLCSALQDPEVEQVIRFFRRT